MIAPAHCLLTYRILRALPKNAKVTIWFSSSHQQPQSARTISNPRTANHTAKKLQSAPTLTAVLADAAELTGKQGYLWPLWDTWDLEWTNCPILSSLSAYPVTKPQWTRRRIMRLEERRWKSLVWNGTQPRPTSRKEVSSSSSWLSKVPVTDALLSDCFYEWCHLQRVSVEVGTSWWSGHYYSGFVTWMDKPHAYQTG